MELYDWQKRDVETLKANDYNALVTVEAGGGKSALGGGVIESLQPDVTLIIAPKNTFQTAWKPTLEALIGVTPREIGRDLKARKIALQDLVWGVPGVYFTNHTFFTRADVTGWWGDLCLLDEGHLLSAAGKAGQRKLSGYEKKDDPISRRFEHRIAMSGTLFRNNFERAWAMARFVWPDLAGKGEVADSNYYRWLADRMDNETTVTGFEWGRPVSEAAYKRFQQIHPRPEGQYAKIMGERFYIGHTLTAKKWLHETEPGRLVAEVPCVVQHFRRRNCCPAHPTGFLTHEEPTVSKVTYELSANQKKAIKQLQASGMTWLADHPLVAELPITQVLRVRQVCLGEPTLTPFVNDEGEEEVVVGFDADCNSPALDAVLELMDSFDEGEPVVIFLESQKFAEVTVNRLNSNGYTAFEYSGKTVKTRDQNLKTFGTPEGHQVLVGILSAVGTGTDSLQHRSNTEIWLQRADPTTNQQGEARLDRMNGRGQVQRFILEDDAGIASGKWFKDLERQARMIQSTTRKGVR